MSPRLPSALSLSAAILLGAALTGCDPAADSADDGPADTTGEALVAAETPPETAAAEEAEELQGGSSMLSTQGPVEPDDAVLVVPGAAARPYAGAPATAAPSPARSRAVANSAPSGDGGEPAGAPDGPTPRALLGPRRAAVPPVAQTSARPVDRAAAPRARTVRVVIHAPPQQVHRWRHRLRGFFGRWIHFGN